MNKNPKKKTLEVIVEKISNDSTIKVKLERKYPHPKYSKIIKDHKSFLVHNDGKVADLKIGDLVVVQQSRPYSKSKSWVLVSKVK
jgi:small subunit ribosomal protein S17